MKPTEVEYKELEKRLRIADEIAEIPLDQWGPIERMLVEKAGPQGPQEWVANMKLVACNRFLLDHTSIQIMSLNRTGANPTLRSPSGSWAIHGSSMQGIDIDVFLNKHPQSGKYSVTCAWRENIELIAAAPNGPYIEGCYGPCETTPENLVGLMRALVEVDLEPEKKTRTKAIVHELTPEDESGGST